MSFNSLNDFNVEFQVYMSHILSKIDAHNSSMTCA